MADEKITVSIFGRKFDLTNGTGVASVEELAKYVDQKIEDITGGAVGYSHIHVLVLVSLRIAEERFAMEKELESARREMNEKADQMLDILDRSIGLGN